VFDYSIRDYIFLAPNGLVTDGLFEAEYLQGGTRYYGGEASFGAALMNNLWLLATIDGVNATLNESVTSPTTASVIPSETSLPRIPPVRARISYSDRVFAGESIR
jgi:hypothetical protein